MRWYGMAAAQGHARAQCGLGGCYYNRGEGSEKAGDTEEAARWYGLAAAQGDSWAQFRFGCCYEDGEGVIQDDKEAARWWRLAADQGEEAAECSLAMLARSKLERARECKEAKDTSSAGAARLYAIAAELGDAGIDADTLGDDDGQCELASRGCYFKGEGVA